jgi:ATP-dependent DNA ligase
MSAIYTVIEQLASDNSRLAKEAILKKNVNNELLKRVFKLALNPFVQFYIRKIPSYDTAVDINRKSLEDALTSLSVLSDRVMTGHAAINHLQFILGSLSKEDAKIIERIIAKDMRCGVSEATINKIWPGTIPSYPVMLASGYDQKLVDKIKFPAYVQLKLDGMRFNAIVKGEVVEYRSRNGKELTIPNKTFDLPFITMAKFYGVDMVFDGELLVVNAAGKPVNRQTGNGILSKSIKGTMSEQEADSVRATLWDAITFEKFSEGIETEPYSVRMAKLSNAISDMRGQKGQKGQVGHYIDLVWNKQVNDIATAQKIFEKFLAEGQEGTILKSKDGIWEDKRSKTQIKFKGELECELKVVDWEEGTGKNVGRLGALVCESSDGVIRVNVGSGYSDEQRDEYTKKVIGKIVTVKYNARIKDKSGVESLFLPVFIELREDKDKAESSKSIK